MPSFSRIIVVGHLGKDGECRKTEKSTFGYASLAVGRKFEDGFVTDWYNLKAFGYAAETLGKLRKGDTVLAEGTLEMQSYIDKNGKSDKSVSIMCNKIMQLNKENKQSDNVHKNNDPDYIPF